MVVVGRKCPAAVRAPRRNGDIRGKPGRVADEGGDGGGGGSVGGKLDDRRNVGRRPRQALRVGLERGRDLARIDDGAHRDGRHGDLTLADGHQVVMVQHAGPRHLLRVAPAGGGQRHVLDAVPRAVVAHGVDVPGEDRLDVPRLDQHLVNVLPVVAITPADPARVVKENEHMVGLPRLGQGLLQPRDLLRAHPLRRRQAEVLGARSRVPLIAVEDNKEAVLVLERVPERPEMHLVQLLVLPFGTIIAASILVAPIDVVIPRHREPGALELVHDASELTHLLQPLILLVVSLHQVPDRHHQVRLQQVDVPNRVRQHRHPFRRAGGTVAEDCENEGILLGGQGQGLGARTVGEESPGVDDARMVLAVPVVMAGVPDVVHRPRGGRILRRCRGQANEDGRQEAESDGSHRAVTLQEAVQIT